MCMLSGSSLRQRAAAFAGVPDQGRMLHAQVNTSAEVAEEVCSILSATRERGLQAAGHSGMGADEAARVGSSFGDALSQLFSSKVGDELP